MTAATRTVTFIDSRVADYQTLIDGLAEGTEWFLLDAGKDGIRQMESILSGYTGLDAIQVISHGSAGTLYLGSTVLDSGNLSAYQYSLQAIGASLSETGDILLYGCNVGQGEVGLQFIDAVARITGADVAASDDPTGSSLLGGNWRLESQVGQIEPSNSSLVEDHNSYQYLLVDDDYAASTSTTGTVSVGGSKGGNIEIAGDADWFKVTLTAGQTYRFDVKGFDTGDGTLVNPYMRLRDSTGASLALDDDSGTSLTLSPTYNSQIIYSVNSSGEYYVSAGSSSSTGTGSYQVVVTNVTPSSSAGFDFPLGDLDASGRRHVPTVAIDGDGYNLGDGVLDDDGDRYFSVDFGDYENPTDSANDYHLGEDWNREDGADFERDVFAIGDGEVVFAGPATNWLYVVIVKHPMPNGEYGGYVTSMYGHLGSTLSVSVGDTVSRGTKLGTVGDYGDAGSSGDHLHLEIRTGTNPDALVPGHGYSETSRPSGWLDPTDFINAYRSNTTLTAVPTPLISVADRVVGEGDGYVDLVVSLSAPGQNVVTVNYTTYAGSASAGGGNDFEIANGTLTFAIGETTKTVRVELLENTTAEQLEHFRLHLYTAQNATLAKADAMVSIVDNDRVAATPSVFVRDVVVDEKAGTASFVVMLGGPAGQTGSGTVSVDYATSNWTAVAGSDYVAKSGTLVFAPGDSVKTVVVDIADDGLAEGLERFTLNLSNASGATIVDGLGVAEIGTSDATAVASPLISVADRVVGEGDGYVDLVVSLSAPGQNVVTVNYTTYAGSASAGGGNDFEIANGTLTFAIGETTKTVRVELLENTTAEQLEHFRLHLYTAQNATLAKADAMVSIVDNDRVAATPSVFVRDVVVDEKAGTASFVVMLGGPAGQTGSGTVSVDYATSNWTAVAGSDYVAKSGTLVFAPGDSVKTVVVDIADDGLAEGLERFTLNLSNASGATIVDGLGVAEIGTSDATAVASPLISVADRVVGEGDGYVDLVVSLSAPGQNVVTVNYTTYAGSASAGGGNDFEIANGTLTFAIGETTKTVRVELLENTTAEQLEHFRLHLYTAQNATLAKADAMVSIVDNDRVAATPSVFVRDVVVDEKAGTASFVVMLGGPAGQTGSGTVSVDYATSNWTAVAGSDYVAKSGTLVFAPGDSVKTVVVDIADDGLAEGLERFTLNLSNASGATIVDGLGVAEIGTSDATAVASPLISVADRVVGEGDGYVDLVVSLSAPGQNVVTVNYTTYAGSASAGGGNDFEIANGTLTFAIGETTKTVRVELLENTTAEDPEYFRLNLSGAQNATLGNTFSTVTIIDNDNPTRLSIAPLSADKPEGDAGTTPFTFTVTRTGDISGVTTASWQAGAEQSPDADAADFGGTWPSGTVTFAANSSSETITINVAGDTLYDSGGLAETFTVTLFNASSGTSIDTASASGRIQNDDAPVATITGTSEGELLTGTGSSEILSGLAGNDTLIGGGGNDTLDGGGGTDTADFSGAASAIWVGLGYAGLEAWTRDTTNLASGTWRTFADLINIENVTGTQYADYLAGDGGNNVLNPGGIPATGNDTLDGGAGTDTADFSGAASAIWVNLGYAGLEAWTRDTTNLASGTWRTFADLINIENVSGTQYADYLAGDGGNNVLNPGGIPATGNDTLDGGAGTDTADFSGAASAIWVNLGYAGLEAWTRDTTNLAAGTWRTFADLINIENVSGTQYGDYLAGDGAANALLGGDGNDTLNPGGISATGNDTLDGGAGTDTADFSGAASAIWVGLGYAGLEAWTRDTTNLASGTWRTFADLINIENVSGTQYADYLAGDGGNNVLNPGGIPATGNDTLDGGAGTDTADFSGAASAIWVGLGYAGLEAWTRDTTNLASGTWRTFADLINIENVSGTQYADYLAGDGGANVLSGGLGNDTLDGGAGNDLLTGGLGADTFGFGNTALNASTNVDSILDFQAGSDSIQLENAVFTKLSATGTLSAANFRASAGGTAADANDYILYDTDSGALYYDADGSGNGAAVQFATVVIVGTTPLSAADFIVT